MGKKQETITEKEEEIQKTEGMLLVPVGKLKIEPGLNIREDMGDVDELIQYVRFNKKVPGVFLIKSFMDQDGKFVIVDGHRRMLAVEVVNKDDPVVTLIPCLREDPTTTEEERIYSQFVSNGGKNLNPVEESNGVKKLFEAGQTYLQIGKRLGKSDQWASNRYALADAPEEVKKQVVSGKITIAAAIKIARDPEPEKKLEEVKEKVKEARGADAKIKEKDLKPKGGVIKVPESQWTDATAAAERTKTTEKETEPEVKQPEPTKIEVPEGDGRIKTKAEAMTMLFLLEEDSTKFNWGNDDFREAIVLARAKLEGPKPKKRKKSKEEIEEDEAQDEMGLIDIQ